MPTVIVTNMPSCPYCGLLFRTGEDYDDHKPCEKMQRAALRQRVSDLLIGCAYVEASSYKSAISLACQDAFRHCVPVGVVDSIDSITDYLWQKGVRAKRSKSI